MPLRRRNIGRKAEKSESEGCRARRTDQTATETAEEERPVYKQPETDEQLSHQRRAPARETRLQHISSYQHERRTSELTEARETHNELPRLLRLKYRPERKKGSTIGRDC